MTCRCGKRDQPCRHHRAGRQDDVSGGDIKAGRTNELAITRRFIDRDGRAVILGFGIHIFLQDNAVSPGRNDRAGENPHCLAGTEAAVPRSACGGFTNAGEDVASCRAVIGAGGVAIHRRNGFRRQAQPRCHIRCQHPAHGIDQRAALGAVRGQPVKDSGKGVLDGKQGFRLAITRH